MSETEKIEPCPWCGRETGWQHFQSGPFCTGETARGSDRWVEQVLCGCGASSRRYDTAVEAISAWNHVARSVALLAEAEEALAHMVQANHPTAEGCSGCSQAGVVLSKIRKEKGGA